MTGPNWYYDEDAVRAKVDAGEHRAVIGGLWDELGELQLSYLKSRGLEPQHTLLDIGCGSGRLAVRAASYLNAGNYYGIDISPALLEAARAELDRVGMSDRVGANALYRTGTFELPAHMPLFDYGIAQSVFTHLRLADFESCLRRIKPWFVSGRLFATFFTTPDAGLGELRHEIGGVTTFNFQDPYHYEITQITRVALECGWRADWIGEWRHPRDQQLCELRPN